MSGVVETGETSTVTGKSFIWRVNETKKATHHVQEIESPAFVDHLNNSWKLLLQFSDEGNHRRSNIFLRLHKAHSTEKIEVIGNFYFCESHMSCRCSTELKSHHYGRAVEFSPVNNTSKSVLHTVHYDQQLLMSVDLKIHCVLWTRVDESKLTFADVGKFFNYADEESTDVTLISSNGSTFPAHKAVLAGRSARLARELDILEAQKAQEISVPFSATILRGVLEYIYLEKANVQAEAAVEWLQAAEFMEIENYSKAVEEALSNSITIENATEFCQISADYKILRSNLMSFFQRRGRRIVATPCFQQFTTKHPDEALSLLMQLVANSALD